MSELITNFCSSWIWWWILPFVLGILMGYVLWGKYKARAREMEGSLARYKSTITTMEKDLKKSRNDRTVAQAQLAEVEKKLADKERQNAQLNKQVFEQKESSRTAAKNVDSVNVPGNERNKMYSAGIMGTTGLGMMGIKNEEKSTSPKPTEKPIEDIAEESMGKKSKGEQSNKKKHKNYNRLLQTNLQIIEGIGPKLESILKENSIGTWKELSSKSRGELRAILESYGSRYSIIDPSGWPRQAFKAMNGDWEGLIKLQTEDGSPSKLKKVVKKLGLS